jgi:Tfp pilus assembly protein PilF
MFAQGQRPDSEAERALFGNPAFLANFAPYELRRGRTSEVLDVVWVRRGAAVEPAGPGYAAALARAWTSQEDGDRSAVLAQLRSAVEMEPDGLGLAREELGLEWARRGDGPASRELLEDARRRDPACARARAHLADRAISRGEVLEADSLLTELSRFQRDLAEVHGVRARLFAAAGWAKDAETESERAGQAGPRVARLLVNHGILLWRRGAADEARAFWRRAVRADPHTLRYLGDFERAPRGAPAPPLGPVVSDFDFTPGHPREEVPDGPRPSRSE